jgi:hypothetical protein
VGRFRQIGGIAIERQFSSLIQLDISWNIDRRISRAAFAASEDLAEVIDSTHRPTFPDRDFIKRRIYLGEG